jgi:hypothetical protein
MANVSGLTFFFGNQDKYLMLARELLEDATWNKT